MRGVPLAQERPGLPRTGLLARPRSQRPSLYATHRRSSGPSLTAGSVVSSVQAVLRPPPTPTRPVFPLPVVTGYRAPLSGGTNTAGRRAGEGLPSSRRHLPTVPSPLRREVLRGCNKALHPVHGLRPIGPGSAPPLPARRRHFSRRGRLRLTLRTGQVAPPQKGVSTLGFDPAHFQTEPPACYRASWRLPGRDSHPLATTSLCSIRSSQSATSNSGRSPTGCERGPRVSIRRGDVQPCLTGGERDERGPRSGHARRQPAAA
jgi:hypothetical protein